MINNAWLIHSIMFDKLCRIRQLPVSSHGETVMYMLHNIQMISTKQAPPYELLSTIANIFRGTVASGTPSKGTRGAKTSPGAIWRSLDG